MIVGYVGGIGHGKTMLAVREAVRIAKVRRVPILSNIRVKVPDVESLHIPVGEDGLELPDPDAWAAERPGVGRVVLIDEIGIITPARFWQSGLSIELMWTSSQSRKSATDIVYTAQDVEQVDAFVRRLTEYVSYVRAFPRPTIERREAGKRPWFITATRWKPAKVGQADKRLGRDLIRYRREIEGWYDTDELVRPPASLRRGRSSKARAAGRQGGAPDLGAPRVGWGRTNDLDATETAAEPVSLGDPTAEGPRPVERGITLSSDLVRQSVGHIAKPLQGR